MLLKFSSWVSLFVLLAAAQANAGIGLHYSGNPVQNDGQDFNFAVSSTTPNMMEPSDSPSEPTTPYFPNFVQLRNYILMGRSNVQAPIGGGGGFGSGGVQSGANSGGGFPGIVRRRFARIAFGANGGPGFGGGAGRSGAGGSAGVGGGGTTSNDQTVSGTDGVVCVTKTGTTDPGLGDGGESGSGGEGGGGDDGQPSPSAVPEPSSFALLDIARWHVGVRHSSHCWMIVETKRKDSHQQIDSVELRLPNGVAAFFRCDFRIYVRRNMAHHVHNKVSNVF